MEEERLAVIRDSGLTPYQILARELYMELWDRDFSMTKTRVIMKEWFPRVDVLRKNETGFSGFQMINNGLIIPRVFHMESNTRQVIWNAAHDSKAVSGLTHRFYRYPARFSPSFAKAAIECFSDPEDLVLDPFSGGGTTAVEALALGRRVVANDINQLSIFLARVKTTPLYPSDIRAVREWANSVAQLKYTDRLMNDIEGDVRLKNLNVPKAQKLKKVVALALEQASALPTKASSEFARCVVLNGAQAALDGNRSFTSVRSFVTGLGKRCEAMIAGIEDYMNAGGSLHRKREVNRRRKILNHDARKIHTDPFFRSQENRPKLVATSPPYPGVHVLYHRWQVDGRKETPAPYWISQCHDGDGSSHYTFGCRKQPGLHKYFETAYETFSSIHSILAPEATVVQLIAFSEPESQLPRYLEQMEAAGFAEKTLLDDDGSQNNERIWRSVPNRKWHANLQGKTSSSKEVVLIHQRVG